MYFVYPFDFARHDNKADMMVAPWYSAMAEGLGLTVFSLLFEVTNDAVWRTAADATFATFLNPRVADQPWTVLVDADGYYWLELYPKDVPDYTLNGHIHATEGLFDYYRLTQNPDALALASGALTTVVHLLPSFRTVGWISRYCLAHPSRNPDYHYFHVGQLLQLYTATGKAVFAEWSDRLAADYPNPAVSGTVVFARGTYTGYRFDATGRIIGSKAYTLPRASSAPANARKRIATRSGLWLHITAGVWADYWIQESRSAFIRGTILPVRYDPVRRVVFLPGTWTGYKFDSRGTVIASRVGGIISPSTASASTRAIINGRPYLLITNGMWAGYWVGESASIYFAPGG